MFARSLLSCVSTIALLLLADTPLFGGSVFLVDFEKSWPYGTAVDNTYASEGVTFVNVLGLSNNDGLGGLPNGDYYANAPTPLGVAFAQLDGVYNTAAYMNVAAGVDGGLSFYYSSPTSLTGAVKAYSGLNGFGKLLGSIDLAATGDATTWSHVTFKFTGTAESFDLTGTANVAALDNIGTVPEPTSLMLAACGVAGACMLIRHRRGA